MSTSNRTSPQHDKYDNDDNDDENNSLDPSLLKRSKHRPSTTSGKPRNDTTRNEKQSSTTATTTSTRSPETERDRTSSPHKTNRSSSRSKTRCRPDDGQATVTSRSTISNRTPSQQRVRPPLSSAMSIEKNSIARSKNVQQRNRSTPRPSSVQRTSKVSSPIKNKSSVPVKSSNSRPASAQRTRSLDDNNKSPTRSTKGRPSSVHRSRSSVSSVENRAHDNKSMDGITDDIAANMTQQRQNRSGKRPDQTKTNTVNNGGIASTKDEEIPNQSSRRGSDHKSPSRKTSTLSKKTDEMKDRPSQLRSITDTDVPKDTLERRKAELRKSNRDLGRDSTTNNINTHKSPVKKRSTSDKSPTKRKGDSDTVERSKQRELRKSMSSPDMDVTPHDAKSDKPKARRKLVTSKSTSFESENQSQHESPRRSRRTPVRAPSMQNTNTSSESHNDSPMQPNGNKHRSPSRSFVRKPSLECDEQDSKACWAGKIVDEKHSDDSSSISQGKGESTVIQFDPTIGGGIVRVGSSNDLTEQLDENDDCFSMASSFHNKSFCASELENSWAAPVLSFLDSDGEELDEKPQARRHNSSSKLSLSFVKPPSLCGDSQSVHTKSSESNGSSSFGRPQYYAPQHSRTSNTSLFADAFTNQPDKIQSVHELSDNFTAQNDNGLSKAVIANSKKTKPKDNDRMDADDEKSRISNKSNSTKSRYNDALRQMSNHSNHSMLKPPSDDSHSESDDSDNDDRLIMGNVFKSTPLNVNNTATPYDSEMEKDTKSIKKGKVGIGKYFFGKRDKSKKPKQAAEESDVSDSEYSCSSEVSSSSRRSSGVFGGRRFSRVHQNHTLLGDDDDDNDVVPF